MDRNLLDQTHAWEQTLIQMRRDIADLRARVGSSAIVVANEPTLIPPPGDPGVAEFVMVSVDVLPGKWMIYTSVNLSEASPTTTMTWATAVGISSRATGSPIAGSADALPVASVTPGVSGTPVTHTLGAFGWAAVDPTQYPDGFTAAFGLRVPGGGTWPSIVDARIALLPF